MAERVTVVVRTKDRPVLLARALDDLLSQELRDWSAIVVNDGGAPADVDALVAARSEALAGRLTVLHHASSRGMEAASNAGVGAGAGEYVAVHDDDDTWAPNFLADTVAHLDAHPDAVAVAAPTDIVYERIDGDHTVETGRVPFAPPGGVVTVFDLLLLNRVVPIALLFRRSAWETLGGFDESLPVVGDWDFNLRLSALGSIDRLEGPALAFWHQRPEGHGAQANSVFSETDAHLRYDRIVRDRALRNRIAEHGAGDLLYLSKFIDERIAQSERRVLDELGAMEARLTEHARQHSLRGTVGEVRRRIRARRGQRD